MWGKFVPAVMIGTVAGIDNIAAALAMGALIFAGPLSSGMGLGVGVVLLGGALLSLVVSLRSVIPNSIALVQETTIAILAVTIVTMATQSTGDAEVKVATAVAIIGASSLATGILFWVTGRFKLGGLVRFLPYPVVAGFLAGSGWLLVDGAANMLTGHGLGLEFLASLKETDIIWRVLPAVIFAIVMFGALNRFTHSATMPLIIIAATIGFYIVLWGVSLPTETARSMGHLPQLNASGGIDLPTLDILALVDWQAVAMAAPSMIVIAGLSMVGLMLNISGLELALGRDIDIDAELCSSGFANIMSGSVGGASGFVGLSLTVLADKTGANGRGPGIVTAIVMLLGLFAAGSLIFKVPIFITGGFVFFLGLELLYKWLVDTRQRMPFSEWLIVAIILLTVALIGFTEGLAVGLLVSSAVFVFKYSRLPVVRLHTTGVVRRSTVDRSLSDTKYLSDHGDAVEVVQLQGYLFFGTADHVVDLVRRRLAESDKPRLRFIVLDFQNVSGADSAAVTCFVKIRKLVDSDRVTVIFTNVPGDLEHHLKLAGIAFDEDPLMKLDVDLDHALEKVEEAVLSGRSVTEGQESLLSHFISAIGHHPRLPALIDNMTKLEMKAEDVLIKQGEVADDVFFVAAGRVRVQIRLPNGNILRLRTMLVGAIVGEIALYLNQTRTADVIVDTASEIYRLSADDFKRLERDDAVLAALAHRLLASNLSEKLSVANKTIQLSQS